MRPLLLVYSVANNPIVNQYLLRRNTTNENKEWPKVPLKNLPKSQGGLS
jgi:FPC/CPF motif-containing protein YcgG